MKAIPQPNSGDIVRFGKKKAWRDKRNLMFATPLNAPPVLPAEYVDESCAVIDALDMRELDGVLVMLRKHKTASTKGLVARKPSVAKRS